MKRIFWINLVSILFILSIQAQPKEEILLTVGSESVTRSEFERIYLKNSQMVEEADRKSLEEYLELFIVYKLKVAEAKNQGLHNSDNFKQELKGYKKQLVQPFLIDKETEQRLAKQAYERMKYEVNASHILIAVPENSSPEDTFKLYDKTLRIRDRIIKGESFEEVARATSDDPSVKNNGGTLGYFSVFQMVYPFENAAFETPVGQVSMPIRTQFGYHIVRVNDKRASFGQVRASHIMIGTPPNSSPEQKHLAKEKIDSIYKHVLNNEDFANLARLHSQDPGSARNGGELPWFGSGRMVPEFEKTAFSLQKQGEVSNPIQTQFGWHIIKLLEKKSIGTFDEMLPEIMNRISRDERGRKSKTAFIEKLKSKNNFKIDSFALYTMVGLLDSSLYTGDWKMPARHYDRTLFTFADKKFTLGELGERISNSKLRFNNIPFATVVDRFYVDFVEESLFNFEESRLIAENTDFYYLMKEYHDGILLFEIMDQNVWTKAVTDEEGLENFYKNNIKNYRWDQRIHTKLYTAQNQTVAKKALKLVTSRKGSRLNDIMFQKRFISKDDTLLTITDYPLLPENPIVKGHKSWNKGVSSITSTENEFQFIRVIKTETNEIKPLAQIRGQVIADYQDFLEQEWLKSLRMKHTITINKEVLEKILSSLN